MRKILVVGAVAVMLAVAASAAAAEQEKASGPRESYYSDSYDDSQSHPLRLAAYFLHPVGYLVEWVVMRPLHTIFAQPQLEPVFGHYPHAERLPETRGRY